MSISAFPAFDVGHRGNEPDALTLLGLTVVYRVRGQDREVLQDVSLRIRRGESYGLVGESGCGKSTAALAALRYLPRNGRVKAGKILVGGADLQALNAAQLRQLRSTGVSVVYQDPGRALNPALSVGRQVAEAFEAGGILPGPARQRAAEMLERVRIADPARAMASYPHQLSGGMQQRVIIAMALAGNPALLMLDEPTTGLDATVEAEVLDLLTQLRREFSTALLFISHNLAVIGRMCDRVGVLYAGKLVEEGATRDVFEAPRHPYTIALLRCLPHPGRNKREERLETIAGALPPLGFVTPGCIYAARCPLADERCHRDAPPPYRIAARAARNSADQMARCHYHERAAARSDTSAALGSSGSAELAESAEPIASTGSTESIESAGGASADSSPQADAPPATEKFQVPGSQAPGLQPRSLLAPSSGTHPALKASNVSKTFMVDGVALRVVDNVSLDLAAGETLGLVGESGSGKTTLAKLLLGLMAPDPGGVIELNGAPLPARVTRRTDKQVKDLQIVFQNPDSALNRAHSVRRLIGRALNKLGGLRGVARDQRLAALVAAVRLPERYLGARTRQLSGGLKQRVAIARAFAADPRIVVCDEPTSALDVSVQAAILNLLADLQAERGVSYIFISHDLNVVRYMAERIAVLYRGQMLEIGAANDVFEGPRHPYTEALLAAVPRLLQPLVPARSPPPATPNAAAAPATGRADTNRPTAQSCIFEARCPRRLGAICADQPPPWRDAGAGHIIRCHIPLDALREAQRTPV